MRSRGTGLALLSAVLLALTVGAAARGPRWKPAPTVELDPEQRSAIRSRFDHAKHEKILGDEGISCLGCHPLNVALAEGMVWTDDLSGVALEAGSLSCHYCHNVEDGPEPGPGRCRLCHEPEQVAGDERHGPGWRNEHGEQARRDYTSCRECHHDYTCVECHERKNDARWAVHDGTWRSTHGIDARIQPGRCETCHLASDCLSCHTDRGGRLR